MKSQKGGPSDDLGSRRSARTAGQRAGVTGAAIVESAKRVAEHEGLEHVTMRRLATELGVMPNALYTYFPNKTAILDAVLDSVLGEIEPADPLRGDWREGLHELMSDSRRLLLRHPRLVTLFLARPGGPNAIRLGESMLQLFARGGVHGKHAVAAMRALLVYMMGFAAIEVPRTSDPDPQARLAQRIAQIRDLPEALYPFTRALAVEFATHPSDADFESGLRWILDGIAREADSA